MPPQLNPEQEKRLADAWYNWYLDEVAKNEKPTTGDVQKFWFRELAQEIALTEARVWKEAAERIAKMKQIDFTYSGWLRECDTVISSFLSHSTPTPQVEDTPKR